MPNSATSQRLILVDYENIGKIDLSLLDASYRAIIFVGAKQNTPKASRKPSTAHRFSRVDFHKIEWVSSLGIAGLIRARKSCIEQRGWFRLARLGKRIEHVITTGGFIFDTFETVDDAIRWSVNASSGHGPTAVGKGLQTH